MLTRIKEQANTLILIDNHLDYKTIRLFPNLKPGLFVINLTTKVDWRHLFDDKKAGTLLSSAGFFVKEGLCCSDLIFVELVGQGIGQGII